MGTSTTLEARLSERLERWLAGEEEKTVGSLIDLFGTKSFAILFVLLLAVPALPVPTAGVTHVLELIAMLVALQLIANRREIWLPQRWRRMVIAGAGRTRFLAVLMGLVRRLERLSRPRMAFLFGHRASNAVFGALVIGGSVAAFLAPPFSGLDTLPALGVVILSLGVLLEDFVIVVAGIALGTAGVVLEIALGTAVVNALGDIL